jgi:hypothetical protein
MTTGGEGKGIGKKPERGDQPRTILILRSCNLPEIRTTTEWNIHINADYITDSGKCTLKEETIRSHAIWPWALRLYCFL